MPIPMEARLPPGFVMADGMKLRVTAVDAVTGAAVTAVQIAGVSIDYPDDSGSTPEPPPSPVSGAYSHGDVPA